MYYHGVGYVYSSGWVCNSDLYNINYVDTLNYV